MTHRRGCLLPAQEVRQTALCVGLPEVRTPLELEACAYGYVAISAKVALHAPMPALPSPVSSVSIAVEGAIPIERHQVSLHERKVGCPSELSNTTLRYCVNKGSCDDVQCKPSVSPSLCPTPPHPQRCARSQWDTT